MEPTSFTDTVTHELGHTIGLKDQIDPPCYGSAMSQRHYVNGVYETRSPTSAECAKARDVNKTPSEQPPTPECYSDAQCIGLRPYCVGGSCVQCLWNYHCWGGGFATTLPDKADNVAFACILYQCVPVSPLVLHLPDYASNDGGSQSWWRNICDENASTVCLDWFGTGETTCTRWTAPDNEDVGFVVNLSNGDLLDLATGIPVPVEPSIHFFGNVTRGPDGDFPFENGFEALASFCDGDAESEIGLSACAHELLVWVDDGDGIMTAEEIRSFAALGIESLGKVREVGKRDECGNYARFEAHATCADKPGRCGTWIDIFFSPTD